MKKLIAMMLLVLPMMAMAQDLVSKCALKHKNADIVLFADGGDKVKGDGADFAVEYVAIYTSTNKICIKKAEAQKEIVRVISMPFTSDGMFVGILEGGGNFSYSTSDAVFMYSPKDDDGTVAFNMDLDKITEWMKRTGKQ